MHNQSATNTLSLNALYGVTDDFSIALSYPYVFRSNVQVAEGQVYNEGDSIGFGDLTLSARYRFLEVNDWHAALIAGLKLPTGETSERASDGVRLGADHQPGTGSVDPVMGFAISKITSPVTYSASALYRLSTQGSQDVTVGDTVLYNLAASYLLPRDSMIAKVLAPEILGHSVNWALVMEINGVFQERLEYAGLKEAGHGGNTIFLSPGVTAGIDDRVFANLSLGFPLIDELSGIQPGTGLRIFFSLNYLL